MRTIIAILLVAAALTATAPAPAQTTSLSTSLTDAIAAASETGGRIELEAGDYGALTLRQVFPADRPLVLAAAHPSDPPRFSGLDIHGAGNVVLENLVLDYRYSAGDPHFLRPFQISEASGITLRGLLIDGDVARGVEAAVDGYPTAYGLTIQHSKSVHVEGCEIRGFLRGIITGQSQGIVILQNDLHGLRSDGMNFAQVEDVLIEGNHLHDFDRALDSGDHPDMIQFWTNGTNTPSRNVTIRGNLLSSGQGAGTQSIFMRNDMVDRGLAGDEMFYRDITIEGNFIHNAHLHGITVGETDGLVVRGNTLVHNPAGAGARPEREVWRPRINISQAARNVVVTRNVTHGLSETPDRADWRVDNNLVVQDHSRLQGNFYGTVFAGWDWQSPQAFAPRPGGPLDGTGIGASLSP